MVESIKHFDNFGNLNGETWNQATGFDSESEKQTNHQTYLYYKRVKQSKPTSYQLDNEFRDIMRLI